MILPEISACDKFRNIEFLRDVPYSRITTAGVGTVLPLLARISTTTDLQNFLQYIHAEKIKFFVFGAGSNVIGMDAPFKGVGIQLCGNEFSSISVNGNSLCCGAAAKLPIAVQEAARNALGGLSPLCGIPGTIGGALKMNAGAGGASIGQFVAGVRGFHADGREYNVCGDKLEWDYRYSTIPADVIITCAELHLTRSDAETEKSIITAELQRRKTREPAGRNAGCTFRNVSNLDPAGMLIDSCGLKNFRIGKVSISDAHANFIICDPGAKESDFVALVSLVRRAVAEKTGFFLKLENIMLNPAGAKTAAASAIPPKVTVLYGGVSSEREVSLRSGAAVAKALANAGMDVTLSDIKRCAVNRAMRDADVVYPVLHGGFGEDGRIQKAMEQNNICFTCSGSKASELVMDKIASKKLFDRLGIPTAKWAILTPQKTTLPENFKFPLVLKAPWEGSTVGIIKVDKKEDFRAALAKEFAISGEILAEEFISGVEITVPVLLGKALDAIEIRSPHGFYDYDAKYVYKSGHTQYFCPPESVAPEIIDYAKKLSTIFYHAAGCDDLVRVDFIITPEGIPMALEGNSLPGCTATSLVPKSARQAGISMEKMTSSLVYAALKRIRKR